MKRFSSVRYGIIGVLAFFTVFVLILSGGGEGATITVDDDGGADYEKIQDAIDNATAGDTIEVSGGEYHENLLVDKTLAIEGQHSDTTIIRSNLTRVIDVRAPWTNISGFHIIGTKKGVGYGINARSENNRFFNNLISECSGGILLDGHQCDSTIIELNEFRNNSQGIRSQESASISIQNNSFYDNQDGIFLQNFHVPVHVSQNSFFSYHYSGIYVYNSENLTIHNNSFRDCSRGIHTYISTNINLRDNVMIECNNGIKVDESDLIFIVKNIFLENFNAVLCEESSRMTLISNTMTRCGLRFIRNDPAQSESHTIDLSNTINGRKIYYIVNENEKTIPSDAGQVIIVNCTNITASGLNLSHASTGIYCIRSNSCEFKNNDLSYSFNRAVSIRESNDNVIQNNIIQYSGEGIYLYYSDGNSIIGNNISHSIGGNWYGRSIHLTYSNNNTFLLNGLNDNLDAIYGEYSDDCSFTDNIIHRNGAFIDFDNSVRMKFLRNDIRRDRGHVRLYLMDHLEISHNSFQIDPEAISRSISIQSSKYLIITGNTFEDCGLRIHGGYLEDYASHTIDDTNLVNGKRFLYYRDVSGISIPRDAGQIMIANCSYMTVNHLSISNCSTAILIAYSDHCSIAGNILTNVSSGIILSHTNNIAVRDNIVTTIDSSGIGISYSEFILVYRNTLSHSKFSLIYLSGTDDSIVQNNTCTNASNYGILLSSKSGSNILEYNWITDCEKGIRIYNIGSGNIIRYNSIHTNEIGIDFYYLNPDILIHHNNIFDNDLFGIQVNEDNELVITAINNYWGDPSGPHHEKNNSDGKGDNVTDLVLFDPWLTTMIQRPVTVIDSIAPSPALISENIMLLGHSTGTYSIQAHIWSSDIDGDLSTDPDAPVTIDPLSPGIHIISYSVQDSSGIWSVPVTTSLIVHERPVAVIESIEPLQSRIGETITFTGSGTDDGSVELYVWTSSLAGELYNGTSISYTETSLSAGIHTITLIVQDDSGAWSEPVTYDIDVLIVPGNDIPLVTITSHANWTNVSGTIDLGGSATDSIGGIQHVEVSHNNGPWIRAEGTDEWTYTIDTTALENGHHFFRVRAFDATDHSEIVTVVLAVDRKGDSGGGGGMIPGFDVVSVIVVLCGLSLLSRRLRATEK